MPRKKKSKYKKTHLELWKCKGCDFEWAYKTMKCPLCYGCQTIKIL